MYGQMMPMPEFPGNGILPSTLDRINPAHYAAIANIIESKGGRLASFYGLRMYDSIRIAGGVGIPQNKEIKLFQKPVGAEEVVFNGSVASDRYNKLDVDTNFQGSSNGLPSGHEFWFWSMQAQVDVGGTLDDTVYTTGDNITLPLVPGSQTSEVAADPIIATNLMIALRKSFYFKLYVNSTGFEDGMLAHFPTKYILRAGGAAAGSPSVTLNDTVVSNGDGKEYTMPIIRHIPEQVKFYISAKCVNAFTSARPLLITFILEGLGMQPITG